MKSLKPDEIKAECLLPIMVDDFMKNNGFEVKVLKSEDKWFGMTYQTDKAIVSESLKDLHDNGVYPESLRP